MADGHGGYRRPSSPAAVSGPGSMSRRTDGAVRDLPDAQYGEGKTFRELQQAAPVSANPGAAPGPTAEPVPMPTGLGAPSEMAGMPVTAGADAGAGPGMADIGLRQTDEDLKQRLGPALPALMRMADSNYATTAFKEQVRQLIARVS